MSTEADFIAEAKNFKATQLTSRHKFKEKLQVRGSLDGLEFKSDRELVGGGDVEWPGFVWNTVWRTKDYNTLESRKLKLWVVCKHDKDDPYGSCEVDLWTLATGPSDHNLPLLDGAGKTVGRLIFTFEFEEQRHLAVVFQEVKLKNLPPVEKGPDGLNPYLKYAYSREWVKVVEGKIKATYSDTKRKTTNPVWDDLPALRFLATLKELMHESVVLHITHRGSTHNTTVGRCNLLFRTLVDQPGKTIKEEEMIQFKGPIKAGNAEIEGRLIFKFLPRFAHMKAVNVVRKPLHTEKGIFDGAPLLPGVMMPKVPVILSPEDKAALDDTRISTPKKRDDEPKKLKKTSSKNLKKTASSEKAGEGDEKEGKEEGKAEESAPQAVEAAKSFGNLIDLTETPPMIKRQRSSSFHAAASPRMTPTRRNLFPESSSELLNPIPATVAPEPVMAPELWQQKLHVVHMAQIQSSSQSPMGSLRVMPVAPQFNPFANPFGSQPFVAVISPPAGQFDLRNSTDMGRSSFEMGRDSGSFSFDPRTSGSYESRSSMGSSGSSGSSNQSIPPVAPSFNPFE